MGFTSGAVSFRRYAIRGGQFGEVDDAFLEAVSRRAFGRNGTAAEADEEAGWISSDHLFDVDFAGEKVAAGRFAHLALRIDRNSVPAAVLRSYVTIEQLSALDASGRTHLTRDERRQAKDAATRRAQQEAGRGAFRRISAYPVLIDLERRRLYVGSTATNVNDRLRRLFEDTFEAGLVHLSAHELAVSHGTELADQRYLEDARPAHWIDAPDGVDGDAYGPDPTDRGFLGREFISWLWYMNATSEGVVSLLTGADVTLLITEAAQLRCDFNLSGAVTLRADAPAGMPEARAAMAAGKQPVKTHLLLASRAGEWSFALQGMTFDVSSAALPPGQQDNAEALLAERFESVADLAETIDGLFDAFLRVRLSADWPTTHAAMRQWVAAQRVRRSVRSSGESADEPGVAAPRLASA